MTAAVNDNEIIVYYYTNIVSRDVDALVSTKGQRSGPQGCGQGLKCNIYSRLSIRKTLE